MKKSILVLATLGISVCVLAQVRGRGIPGVTGYASIRAFPAVYRGRCPHAFSFHATIHSRGAGVVYYHWERSDGTNTATQSHGFSGPNQTFVIVNNWTPPRPAGGHIRGWEALRVTSPNSLRTPNAVINLYCTE